MVPIPKIVIAGGGIVGNSIAYFLSKRQVPVTLIDPVGIAPCASGKAGGFLAKDWRDGTDLQELQRAGFELHQTLANELGASNIDYRRLTCQAVAVDASQQTKKPTKNRKSKTLEWVDHDGVFGSSSMGDKQTIAQVHPKKLCQELWKYSESQGSVLKIGKVVKVLSTTADSDADADASEASSPHNIQLEDGSIIPADKFVIACGPWTEHARDWFPKDVQDSCWPVITGVKCHSVLVQAPKTLSEAVFFERAPCSAKSNEKEEEASNSQDNKLLTSEQLSSVEVYPRPDGDAYVNGFEGDEAVIPEEPGQEVIDPKAVQDLELALQQTSSMLEGLTSHTQQVCYWPETPDGMPILDCLDNNNDDDEAFLGGKRSIYVAAGHSVWGILQGPISGKAMSELILDGEASCIDLTPFQLERFMYDNDNDDGSSSSSSSSSSSDDEIY